MKAFAAFSKLSLREGPEISSRSHQYQGGVVSAENTHASGWTQRRGRRVLTATLTLHWVLYHGLKASAMSRVLQSSRRMLFPSAEMQLKRHVLQSATSQSVRSGSTETALLQDHSCYICAYLCSFFIIVLLTYNHLSGYLWQN